MPHRTRIPLAVLAFAAATAVLAAPARLTENVVLITTDGLRWQEVFGGAEEALLAKEAGVAEPAGLRREFWRDTPEARREALLPFLWTVVARQGQIYGNGPRGSVARVTNGRNFSYPGYNELLSGRADARIDSNDKKNNPNVTVLEWLNGRAPYLGRVAAFGSWDTFPWILNRGRSGLLVNAGFEPMPSGDPARVALLNQLMADTTPAADGVRHDSLTFAAALEHVRAARPRVLYLALGETDDWAHAGRYDHYLHSARRFDDFTRRLWEEMQSMDEYRGRTTFVITTDHGRGSGLTEWKSHGEKLPASENIWIAALGPDTSPLGERTNTRAVTQSQVAATVAAALGEDFPSAAAGIAAPIAEALGGSGPRGGSGAPAAPRPEGAKVNLGLSRGRLLELLGPTPAVPPPLAPEEIERVDLGDVIREKVTYAVEAGERVPAYVFLPKEAGRHPAVLCHHQHGGEFEVGKLGPAGLGSTEDQHYALELARRGYVAIAPDALAFGERQDPTGKLKGASYERFEALHRIAEGKSLQGKYVWDARRALDYLETRPEVDAARMGMIGHSLGGQETLFTTAADTRIKAAVSSCGFGSLRTLARDRILHNFALFAPGLAAHGDYGALLALVAPRPFLVAARTDDPIFPVDGIEETVAVAKRAYAAAGAEDKLGTFYEPGPHQFSPALRQAAYAWLDRWLKPKP